ncbi:Receptor expression-enhancing protein, partial [Trichostrongylus colubriformis]
MKSKPDTNKKTPSEGVREAHSDLIHLLYKNKYDKSIARVEAVSGLPREKTNYGLRWLCWVRNVGETITSLVANSGIPKLFYILAAIVAFYLIIGAAAQIVCNLIGFGYPAYASVKAVRTRDTKDDTQWLIYWCVFAVFSLIDFFAGSIMQWFPFYYLTK